jgi:hypothetical protein
VPLARGAVDDARVPQVSGKTLIWRKRRFVIRQGRGSGMLELLVRIAVIIGASVLWFAGLRLFLQSNLSRNLLLNWAGSQHGSRL